MSELNSQQKRHLYEHGWVLIPQVLPKDRVRAAQVAIHSSVEQYLDSIQVRSRELSSDERLKDLLMKTEAFSLVESALGKGKVVASLNIQAALRFPDLVEHPLPLDPHIDSFHPSANGQPGSIRPFTALVGFFLNDIGEDWAGNLTVWPGTHRSFEKYFQAHEPDPELKFGIPPIPLPEPVQLKARAGDMVLAHYQLAHTASSNLSNALRYIVYFRIHHADKPKDSVEVLSDIWRYWEGMTDVIGGKMA